MNRRNFFKSIITGILGIPILSKANDITSFEDKTLKYYTDTNPKPRAVCIKGDIEKVLREFLYVPNNDITRKKILLTVSDVLEKYLTENHIFEYRVVCDETNNTPIYQSEGILLCHVYIKYSPIWYNTYEIKSSIFTSPQFNRNVTSILTLTNEV